MDAIVSVRACSPLGWSRIHLRFHSLAAGRTKPIVHHARLEKSARGILA
jgi:hypothetical protein